MDTNTRLENEDLFDSQNSKGKNRIISLNEQGIFTVEDFINSDVINITKTPYIRRYYTALQHALRYKYKGEPLAVDVLLDKVVKIDRSICRFNSPEVKIRIATNLGFEIFPIGRIAKDLAKKKMIDNDDFYQHSAVKNGGYKQDSYIVTMMEIIKSLAQSGNKLAQFYVDYKEQKELEEKQQEEPSVTLEKMKSELVLLTAQRDKLDEMINLLTKQVKILEGGNEFHGRK